ARLAGDHVRRAVRARARRGVPMTAPRLSLDDARSFEVPCLFDDKPTSVRVRFYDGAWWVHLMNPYWFLCHPPDTTLDLGPVWHPPAVLTSVSCPTAQEAGDAAFATGQIEPRGAQK